MQLAPADKTSPAENTAVEQAIFRVHTLSKFHFDSLEGST